MNDIDWSDAAGTIIGVGFWILVLGFPIVSSFMPKNDDSSAAASAEASAPASDYSSTVDYSDYPEPEVEQEYDYSSANNFASESSCNSNYTGCVDDSSYDLDCVDIGQEVEVIGYDEFGLDRDGDGYGCESY